MSIFPIFPTVRATMLDDLRLQLQEHPDAGDEAEAWIDGDALYVAIRLCLLARDQGRDRRHGVEAERLFGDLVAAYARQDAYAPVQRGRLMYHAPGLVEAACGAPVGHSRPRGGVETTPWVRSRRLAGSSADTAATHCDLGGRIRVHLCVQRSLRRLCCPSVSVCDQ